MSVIVCLYTQVSIPAVAATDQKDATTALSWSQWLGSWTTWKSMASFLFGIRVTAECICLLCSMSRIGRWSSQSGAFGWGGGVWVICFCVWCTGASHHPLFGFNSVRNQVAGTDLKPQVTFFDSFLGQLMCAGAILGIQGHSLYRYGAPSGTCGREGLTLLVLGAPGRSSNATFFDSCLFSV